ncbi:hypothetical protein D3C84_662030 [compost metagenome]
MSTTLAITPRFHAAVLVVRRDRVLFQVDHAPQLLAGRGTVFDFVVAPGEGFAEVVVLREILGGGLQIGNGAGAFLLGFGTGQTHTVVGAKAWVVRFTAHGLGQPCGALRQVAGFLRGDRCGVKMPGIGSLLQGGPLAL